MPRSLIPALLLALGLAATPGAVAQHIIFSPEKIEWKDAPPSLPPGAKIAVLHGDPTQAGLFTLRLKYPANYRFAPHWHPADEHATILSGTLHVGVGDEFDKGQAQEVKPGSLVVMPARTSHFGWTDSEVVLQLHGIGPWQVNYVNPADDPRRK